MVARWRVDGVSDRCRSTHRKIRHRRLSPRRRHRSSGPRRHTCVDEGAPALSPDGRWLAYSSDRTGRREVYVRAFPDVGSSRSQVSVNGGNSPRWAPNGGELFYVDADSNMVAAQVETTAEFRVVQRESLFTIGAEFLDPRNRTFEVSPMDGRFLMLRLARGGAVDDPAGTQFVLVQNSFRELRERAGGN
ncbi:MAG TPA: hypothetical protein EYQ83_12885 [Acidobacteria bacterium]|nr:hypothetical protein [Acidobacteriota bacterium]